MKFVFVFLNKKADKAELPKEELDKIMAGHMANIQRLSKEGKLVVAGPFEGGGGIFIFNASATDQVKEWLNTDPGVKANRWNVEVLPYTPRMGSVCAVGEPYQMVTYEFIRYTVGITKYNVQAAPETAQRHDNYLKKLAQTGNVKYSHRVLPRAASVCGCSSGVEHFLAKEDVARSNRVTRSMNFHAAMECWKNGMMLQAW